MPKVNIVSPLPGTFYTRPAPDEPPYVAAGQHVREGDVVGLVEVMKQFSEVTAEADGVVALIAVENNQPVEAGQTLIVIDTP